jgi:SNF2 family DNA or RNA helicase
MAEPDWVPGKNDQLLDRIHRIGQEGDYILGHVPVVPDTLDERILSTAIAKDQNIYRALDEIL